jgi:hypothetical protein
MDSPTKQAPWTLARRMELLGNRRGIEARGRRRDLARGRPPDPRSFPWNRFASRRSRCSGRARAP